MKKDKKLLEVVSDKIRLRHYSYQTEKSYVGWIKRYILFHNKQHPKDMGKVEIEIFLTHLAVERKVSLSTQNQAFNAISNKWLIDRILIKKYPLTRLDILLLRIYCKMG